MVLKLKRQLRIIRKVISMGALKDVVLIIIVASGIVGVCCIASGVRMYLEMKKNGCTVDEICDGIKGLAHINMILGVLLLIVSLATGIWVYSITL